MNQQLPSTITSNLPKISNEMRQKSTKKSIRSGNWIEAQTQRGYIGTLAWMAPEIMKESTHMGPSSDIFSLGCILWEVWQRRKPWSWLNESSDIIDAVLKEKKRLPFKDTKIPAPREYDTLMSTCWHHEREKRPLIDHVRSNLLDLMVDAQSLDSDRDDNDDHETKLEVMEIDVGVKN